MTVAVEVAFVLVAVGVGAVGSVCCVVGCWCIVVLPVVDVHGVAEAVVWVVSMGVVGIVVCEE